MTTPTGIVGVEGTAPIGAVLSAGRKKEGGRGVIERDRFHLVAPKAVNDIRPYIEAFAKFNTLGPEKRRTVYGNLVYARESECYGFRLRNYVAPAGKRHPNRRPFCEGDGERAVRWGGSVDEPDEFYDIKCPNDRCEFRQTKPASCKPWMWFRFRIRWPQTSAPLPTMLVQYESTSWHTTNRFVGMFKYLEGVAKDLGVAPVLFGLPVVLTMTEQTKPSDKSRFPVVVPTVEMDPIDFFTKQQERLRMLRDEGSVTLRALPESSEAPLLVHHAMEDVSVPGPLSKEE